MTNDPRMTHQGMTKLQTPNFETANDAFVICHFSFVIPWWVIGGSFLIRHYFNVFTKSRTSFGWPLTSTLA
jgi:hypothetical protein